jgi:hypothetical protein
MKTLFIFFFCLIHFFIAQAQVINDKQLSKAVDKLLSEKYKPGEPGFVVLIARKGKIVNRSTIC